MSEFDTLMKDLERVRDEIMLKIHLGSMEVKQEWSGLEEKWDDFSSRAKVDESAEGLGSALSDVGSELKKAYARIRDAL